jgi:winged helix DNA-binding protein
LLWEEKKLFEWGAFIRPIEDLPLIRARMRRRRGKYAWERRGAEFLRKNAGYRRYVLKELERRGPLLSRELDDDSVRTWKSHGWYGTRNTGVMLDMLHGRGLVAIVGRRNGQRLWDLAERWYPETETAKRLACQVTSPKMREPGGGPGSLPRMWLFRLCVGLLELFLRVLELLSHRLDEREPLLPRHLHDLSSDLLRRRASYLDALDSRPVGGLSSVFGARAKSRSTTRPDEPRRAPLRVGLGHMFDIRPTPFSVTSTLRYVPALRAPQEGIARELTGAGFKPPHARGRIGNYWHRSLVRRVLDAA